MRANVMSMLRNSCAALWAALVSLALFQAAFAGHTTQHVFEDLGERCEFCLKFDEAKKSFAESGSGTPLPHAVSERVPAAGFEQPTRPFAAASIRAPPFD